MGKRIETVLGHPVDETAFGMVIYRLNLAGEVGRELAEVLSQEEGAPEEPPEEPPE